MLYPGLLCGAGGTARAAAYALKHLPYLGRLSKLGLADQKLPCFASFVCRQMGAKKVLIFNRTALLSGCLSH